MVLLMQVCAITNYHLNIPIGIRSASFAKVSYYQRVAIEASANLNMLSEDKDGKQLFLALVQC